jgi:hypothetical protein
MYHKIVFTAFMSALVLITLSATRKVASTGAPIASTGAPGETTCARSGCHTGDQNLNTGPGKLSIHIDEFNGIYIPGNTYNVTVTLQQQDIERFGFSMVALSSTGSSSGTMEATDPSRTQVMTGSNQFATREYITYKAIGTNPYAANTGQWSFSWTAPAHYEGPVTLYVAAVSANNDGTDKGDQVYTDSLVLDGFATGVADIASASNISIHPNPVSENFTLSFFNKEQAATRIELTDLQGHIVHTLFGGIPGKGMQEMVFERPAHVVKGAYIIRVSQPSGVFNRKIMIR